MALRAGTLSASDLHLSGCLFTRLHSPAWQQGCGSRWWWINRERDYDWFEARRPTLRFGSLCFPPETLTSSSTQSLTPIPQAFCSFLAFAITHFFIFINLFIGIQSHTPLHDAEAYWPGDHFISSFSLFLSVFPFHYLLNSLLLHKQLINTSLPDASHLPLSLSTPLCSSACWSLFRLSDFFSIHYFFPSVCLFRVCEWNLKCTKRGCHVRLCFSFHCDHWGLLTCVSIEPGNIWSMSVVKTVMTRSPSVRTDQYKWPFTTQFEWEV